MLSVSYAGKNAYSAGKTSGVFRGGASGANRGYVLAHCGGEGGKYDYVNRNIKLRQAVFRCLCNPPYPTLPYPTLPWPKQISPFFWAGIVLQPG